ncbi:hypothetical protein K469DRAFT_695861 [Zopfia rhizophila CBS 207.26]|uniref:Uncharacterized protein n=1 Tax=Zopfia rhizophila CBS 207.26 TaxID=1314779 RepID=A0A6A6EKZ7_9PEZI|nr:hypothetical protein K469DRAFT_695861 [Zopfia rhizophila CBS 207.26]
MTCEAPVLFDVDTFIKNIQSLLKRLKVIKKDIQQTPHSGSASRPKTTQIQSSFDPTTISQTLRGIVEEAQRLEAELASPSYNVSREARLVPVLRNTPSATNQRISVTTGLNIGETFRSEERRTEQEKEAQEGDTRELDVNSNTQKDVQESNTQIGDAQDGDTRVEDTQGSDRQVEDGHGSDIQDENSSEDNTQIVSVHGGGQQHPPTANPEVPSFQPHPSRTLRRRYPQPIMQQPQQTNPRARTRSGHSNMTAATKRKPVGILNSAPKKRRSARPDENASNKWIEHIRDQDPGHGLALLKNFERVTSFRFARSIQEKLIRCYIQPSGQR